MKRLHSGNEEKVWRRMKAIYGQATGKTDEWETPQYLFNELDEEFRFTLDAAASEKNHKCEKFFTKRQDGLKQDWGGHTVWCNPPYGRAIAKWVEKATESKATVVMLLPARTDTKWFHEYIYGRAEIRFIKGRVRFGNSKQNAPFPSMIVVFKNNENRLEDYTRRK